MKTTQPILLAVFLLASFSLFSQINSNLQTPLSINADGSAADTTSMLHVQSTSKGMLTPRMATAQRTAITSPANGLLVYDIDTKSFWYYDNDMWNEIPTTMAAPGEESSAAPALAIPDGDPVGVSDTITLAQPGVIDTNTQISVCVNITHPWVSALDISLTGPDGTMIDLSSDNGSSGANYTNACFTTAANTSITSGSAPFTGSWIPEQPFSNFYTKPIAGPWILKVADDDSAVDNGTFDSWSIEITPGSAAPSLLSDKDGDTRIQVEKTPDEDRIRFDVAGAEVMTVEPDRKVQMIRGPSGLAPNAGSILSLENNADGYLNLLTPNNAESGILFGNPGDGPAAGGIVYNNFVFRNGLQFRTNGNTTRMVIDSLGRMGIGFNNPTAPLMIKATSDLLPSDNGLYVFNNTNSADQHAILSARVAGSAAGDPFVSFDIANESGWAMGIDNSDGNKLKFSNTWNSLATNTRMTIQTNGNTGIGIDAPTERLHVNGNIRVADDADIFGLDEIKGFNDLRFSGDATGGPDLSITAAGHVGIGGTSGNVLLDVNNIASNSGGAIMILTDHTGGDKFQTWNAGDTWVLGDFNVTGTKNFILDHPLDPANKNLVHNAVESPNHVTYYHGTVVLGADGTAKVQLPDYFEALNTDFHYQLTCVGGFAQVYIADEISNNQFSIAGGTPGLKVSWQVTATRNDPWVRDHPYEAEIEKKPEHKGKYIYPEGYGLPKEAGVSYARDRD